MTIDGYSIGEYSCLLLVIILMTISGYYIGGDYISDYFLLFVVILIMVIAGYSIDGYK